MFQEKAVDPAALMERRQKRMQMHARLTKQYFARDMDLRVQRNVTEIVDTLASTGVGRMLSVTGQTHVGKSKVIERALRRDPGLRHEGSIDDMPLVRVELLGKVTTVQLGREICHAAGYPMMSESSEGIVWERVHQQLGKVKVKVLWIDEAQHMINIPKRRSKPEEKYVQQVTNNFKGLMKKFDRHHMSIVFSGMPEWAPFLRKDGQVKHMGSFIEIETMQPEDAGWLQEAVAVLVKKVDMHFGGNLEKDLVPRLMHASCHIWGVALRMTIEAILEAAAPLRTALGLPETTDSLVLGHFATVYGYRTGSVLGQNPFHVADWIMLDCSKVLERD